MRRATLEDLNFVFESRKDIHYAEGNPYEFNDKIEKNACEKAIREDIVFLAENDGKSTIKIVYQLRVHRCWNDLGCSIKK